MTVRDQKEYDDSTSTSAEQKAFEAGCLERLNVLTKIENYRRFEEESRKVNIMVSDQKEDEG